MCIIQLKNQHYKSRRSIWSEQARQLSSSTETRRWSISNGDWLRLEHHVVHTYLRIARQMNHMSAFVCFEPRKLFEFLVRINDEFTAKRAFSCKRDCGRFACRRDQWFCQSGQIVQSWLITLCEKHFFVKFYSSHSPCWSCDWFVKSCKSLSSASLKFGISTSVGSFSMISSGSRHSEASMINWAKWVGISATISSKWIQRSVSFCSLQ